MIEAKSVVSKALAVACPECKAPIGDPCTRANGELVAFMGHLGVHPARMHAARHVEKATT